MIRSVVAIAICAGVSLGLAAQALADGDVVAGVPQPTHKGEWKYERPAGNDEQSGLSQDQFDLFAASLGHLADVLHAAASVNPPVGFLVEAAAQISIPASDELTKALPVQGEVRVDLTPYVKNEQGVVPGYGRGSNFFVEVNQPESVLQSESLEDSLTYEDGARFYWAPAKVTAVQGFPYYRSGHLVIARQGHEVFVPASRGDLLAAIVRQAEGQLADHQAAQAQMVANDPLAEWNVGAEERRRTQAETIAQLEKINPAMVVELKAQWAKMEVDMPLAFKKQQEQVQAAAKDDRMSSMLKKRLASLRKELGAMPPAQRAEQAWWLGMGDDMQRSGLAPANAEGARAVVRVNPAWFDKALPKTALQLVTVRAGLPTEAEEFAALEQLTAEGDDFIRYQQYRLFKGVDWATVAALLGR